MASIKDLIYDNKNFNKGTEAGNKLIQKSFKNFGSGRSILIDKNNRIIAGNKSVENASAIGMEDVQIVESDGKRIIAVKRTDIDLYSPEGREMALADNATAKANIIFDAELVEAELGEAVCEEWGVKPKITLEQIEKFSGPNSDFEAEFNNITDESATNPIVPQFLEKYECFVIITKNEIDEQFIRNVFGLSFNFQSEDGKIRKSNVIPIEHVRSITHRNPN